MHGGSLVQPEDWDAVSDEVFMRGASLSSRRNVCMSTAFDRMDVHDAAGTRLRIEMAESVVVFVPGGFADGSGNSGNGFGAGWAG
jgi:hypothetical protein